MKSTERAAFVLILAAGLAGCVGRLDAYDRAADLYADAVRGLTGPVSSKTARYTVHVAHYVGGEPAAVAARELLELDALAGKALQDARLLKEANIARDTERHDWHFVFNIQVETTREPGLFAGLIMPFYRARSYGAELAVLDGKGRLVRHYAASASTTESRHVFLVFSSLCRPPARADERARRSLFEAITVKLIADRKNFL